MPDTISPLLDRIGLRAATFYAGPMSCAIHPFHAAEGLGHLHIIRSGTVLAEQSGHAPVTINEPSLIFYPRPVDHQLTPSDASPASVVCASVRYEAGRNNAITQSFPPVVVIAFRLLPRLELTLAALFAEAADHEPGRQIMLDRLCDILLIQIVRHALSIGLIERGVLAGLSHPRLGVVLTTLLDKPAEPWNVVRMAQLAHWSRNAFSAEFDRVVGTSPAAFLTQVRIASAQKLLRKGVPIARVAGEVGYGSQPAFSRAFIREAGVSPSQWLRQAGEN